MFINFVKLKLNYILLAIILLIAAYFRFTFLGYSDLQGDEAKIFLYKYNSSFLEFLFQNSKGPGQYIIVKLTELLSLNYFDAEFLFRLPFAFVGFLSVFLFYYLAQRFFNLKIAVNVVLIAAFNGFFTAFSRIIQYQSFNIFLGLLSSLLFLEFLKKRNNNYLIMSSLFSAGALLFHYDALGFIVPQLIILFITDNRIKNYLLYIAGLSSSLIFYVPYILNERFVLTYQYLLKDRAISNFSYDSIFYSLKLSTIYFPKEYLFIVFTLAALSMWYLKTKWSIRYKSLLLSLLVIMIVRYFVGHPYKPLILLSLMLAGGIFFIILYSKEIHTTKKYFYIWFVVTFSVYLLFINKPLTHIYNIFIPLTFIAGYQLYKIQNRLLKYTVISVLVISSLSFNYHAYVENKIEYPWQPERYVFGNMYQGISEGEVVRGIFGFPYYRGLDNLDLELSRVVPSEVTPTFSTNIKLSRMDFYLTKAYPANQAPARYYIEVKNDRDYEPDDTTIVNSQKIRIVETENYSIYNVL